MGDPNQEYQMQLDPGMDYSPQQDTSSLYDSSGMDSAGAAADPSLSPSGGQSALEQLISLYGDSSGRPPERRMDFGQSLSAALAGALPLLLGAGKGGLGKMAGGAGAEAGTGGALKLIEEENKRLTQGDLYEWQDKKNRENLVKTFGLEELKNKNISQRQKDQQERQIKAQQGAREQGITDFKTKADYQFGLNKSLKQTPSPGTGEKKGLDSPPNESEIAYYAKMMKMAPEELAKIATTQRQLRTAVNSNMNNTRLQGENILHVPIAVSKHVGDFLGIEKNWTKMIEASKKMPENQFLRLLEQQYSPDKAAEVKSQADIMARMAARSAAKEVGVMTEPDWQFWKSQLSYGKTDTPASVARRVVNFMKNMRTTTEENLRGYKAGNVNVGDLPALMGMSDNLSGVSKSAGPPPLPGETREEYIKRVSGGI